MKLFSTYIHAICPITEELTEFAGAPIAAIDKEQALYHCQNNGLGYLHIGDEIIKTVCANETAQMFKNNILN